MCPKVHSKSRFSDSEPLISSVTLQLCDCGFLGAPGLGRELAKLGSANSEPGSSEIEEGRGHIWGTRHICRHSEPASVYHSPAPSHPRLPASATSPEPLGSTRLSYLCHSHSLTAVERCMYEHIFNHSHDFFSLCDLPLYILCLFFYLVVFFLQIFLLIYSFGK